MGSGGWSTLPGTPDPIVDGILAVLPDVTSDAVLVNELDVTGRLPVAAANDRALQVLGRTAGEVLGHDLAELVGERAAERYFDRCAHVMATHDVLRYTDRVPTDLGVRTFDVRLVPLLRDGVCTHAMFVGTDVTERERFEVAARHGELRFEEQLRALPVPTYTWQRRDDTFVLVAVNDAADRLVEGRAADAYGQPVEVVWAEAPELAKDIERCWQARETVLREPFVRTFPSGRAVRMAVSSIPIGGDIVLVHTLLLPDAAAGADAVAPDIWVRAFETLPTAIAMIDHQALFVAVNGTFASLVGRPAEELVGTPVLDTIHPDDRDAAFGAAMGLVETGGSYEQERRLVRADGSVLQVAVSARLLDVAPGRRWLFSAMRDVTRERSIERRLRESEERHRRLVEGAPDGLLMETGGRITFANPEAAALLRVPSVHGLLGLPVDAVLDGVSGDGPRRTVAHRADGTDLPVDVSVVPTEVGGRSGSLYVVRDLTARIAVEAELVQRAQTDRLTGLGNRDALEGHLEAELARAASDRTRLAVLFVDLDRLKAVNDAYGHAAGDTVIVRSGRRLRERVGAAGRVFRFGGEAFVVVLPRHNAPAAVEVARGLLEALRPPIDVGRASLVVPGSIGVAVAEPDAATGPAALVGLADSAMYRAKLLGGDRYAVYDPLDRERSARRFLVEERLRAAVRNGDIRQAYQPIFDLATGVVTSVEALARWDDDELGSVSPGEFIPVAEQSRLIEELGEAVLREACAAAAGWGGPAVSVNVSARQLARTGFADLVRDVLAEARLPADRLVLEITESLLMAERDRGAAALVALRDEGVRLAIDDFGTGWSSLAYLKRFPISALKIDRGFTSGLPHQPDDVALVRAIIDVAGALGLDVVAEGVETEEQLLALRRLGCGSVQGYLLGRPVPPERLAALLA